MFRYKIVKIGAFIILLASCTPTQPSKTNVLSKPATTAKPAPPQPQRTPVYIPPQVTRDTKKEQETQPAAPQPKPEATPTYTAPAGQQRPAYPSAAYYKWIADSVQQVFSKSSYLKTTDSIARMIRRTPAEKYNPAVTTANWYAAVNFNIRKPNFVVLHHTAQNTAEQTLYTFSITRPQSSAHYVIARNGTVHQMLNDYVRAWHAGNSKWGNITDMNSCSIGIEIDNNGEEPFSDAQIDALLKLLAYLKKEYGIPQANFIAHSDIAPVRKNDPSKYFPWKKIADAGFSYWYDASNMAEPPADFNAMMALRIMGYDISNATAAIKAFKLHYIQNDTSPTLTNYDIKVLYNVYQKYK